MLIPVSEQQSFILCAFSYALGRATYVTETVQNVIIQAWPELDIGAKEFIRRDLERANELDDLGHDMDRKGWLTILKMAQNYDS